MENSVDFGEEKVYNGTMEVKPFYGITSISKDVLYETVRLNGRVPDNFLDSSEGNFIIPDVDRDPVARSLAGKVDDVVDSLVVRVSER